MVTDGSVWLFDCGEGTQIQFQKTPVSSQRITAVFISHLHGDHLFGLPGLLCTISSQLGDEGEAGKRVVDVYGPKGINKFVNTALRFSCSPLIYSFRVRTDVLGSSGVYVLPYVRKSNRESLCECRLQYLEYIFIHPDNRLGSGEIGQLSESEMTQYLFFTRYMS